MTSTTIQTNEVELSQLYKKEDTLKRKHHNHNISASHVHVRTDLLQKNLKLI